MVINWQDAPEGTTHGMVNGGEMRWYRVAAGEDGEVVECWHEKYREWIRSFFLSLEEVEASGLRLFEFGEQSAITVLTRQRDELADALESLLELCGQHKPDPDDAFAIIDQAREALFRCGV